METKPLLDRVESLAIANAGKQRKLDQQRRMLRSLRERCLDHAETIHFLKEEVRLLTTKLHSNGHSGFSVQSTLNRDREFLPK